MEPLRYGYFHFFMFHKNKIRQQLGGGRGGGWVAVKKVGA